MPARRVFATWLNVARMKELTEEKRFALAAALLFRQLARAYDDAADMLIRQVQRLHHKAKELMKLDRRAIFNIPRSSSLLCAMSQSLISKTEPPNNGSKISERFLD
jgi:hypothetical protein